MPTIASSMLSVCHRGSGLSLDRRRQSGNSRPRVRHWNCASIGRQDPDASHLGPLVPRALTWLQAQVPSTYSDYFVFSEMNSPPTYPTRNGTSQPQSATRRSSHLTKPRYSVTMPATTMNTTRNNSPRKIRQSKTVCRDSASTSAAAALAAEVASIPSGAASNAARRLDLAAARTPADLNRMPICQHSGTLVRACNLAASLALCRVADHLVPGDRHRRKRDSARTLWRCRWGESLDVLTPETSRQDRHRRGRRDPQMFIRPWDEAHGRWSPVRSRRRAAVSLPPAYPAAALPRVGSSSTMTPTATFTTSSSAQGSLLHRSIPVNGSSGDNPRFRTDVQKESGSGSHRRCAPHPGYSQGGIPAERITNLKRLYCAPGAGGRSRMATVPSPPRP